MDYVSSNSLLWSPNSPCDGISRQGPLEIIRFRYDHKGAAPGITLVHFKEKRKGRDVRTSLHCIRTKQEGSRVQVMKRACTNNQTCWYHGLPSLQHWSNKRLLFGSLGLWHFVVITSAKTVCYLYFKSTRNGKLLPTAQFLFVALAKNLSKGNFEIRVVIVFSRVFPLPQFSLSLFPKSLSSNFWYLVFS